MVRMSRKTPPMKTKAILIICGILAAAGCSSIPKPATDSERIAEYQATIAKYERDVRILEAQSTVIEFNTLTCTRSDDLPCVFRTAVSDPLIVPSKYEALADVAKERYGFLDRALGGIIKFGILAGVLTR